MNAKTTMSNVKQKLAVYADKVQNSKIYKSAEKVAVSVGAGAVALGTMAVTSFAETPAGENVGTVLLADIKAGDVLNNAMPFINAGIPILVVVGGIRLGMRFLRGTMH